MPIANTYIESLPYIDEEPTPKARAAAEALIQSELPPNARPPPDTPLTHPSLPALFPPHHTPILASEHTRLSVTPRAPLSAIDLSRYESSATPDSSASLEETIALLSRAYAAHSYMQSRASHLSLLSAHGKNAWLIGNWHLEGELRTLERELAAVNREVDLLNLTRSGAQKEVEVEMKMLEETWQKGIARTLETQVATAHLRAEVLEEMKARTHA